MSGNIKFVRATSVFMVIIFIIMIVRMEVLKTKALSDWVSTNQKEVQELLSSKEKLVEKIEEGLEERSQLNRKIEERIPFPLVLPFYLWITAGLLFGMDNIATYFEAFQKHIKAKIRRI